MITRYLLTYLSTRLLMLVKHNSVAPSFTSFFHVCSKYCPTKLSSNSVDRFSSVSRVSSKHYYEMINREINQILESVSDAKLSIESFKNLLVKHGYASE